MSLITELTLSPNLLLFDRTFELVPDAEATFEDVHYLRGADDYRYYVFFWWVSGVDASEFERALDEDETVTEVRQITDIDDRTLFRIVTVQFPPEQPLVFPALRKYDVTSIETRRNADGLHLRARCPSRDALEGFYKSAMDIADSVDVTRLYAEESTGGSVFGLTPKQRDALWRAHDHGYFDTPSRATLDELAAEFDVTPQTLSRHLRVGVKKLVENAVQTNSPPQVRVEQ